MNHTAFADDSLSVVNNIDLSGMQKISDEISADFDVKEVVLQMLSGETVVTDEIFNETWTEGKNRFGQKVRGAVMALLLPMIISALTAYMIPGNKDFCDLLSGSAAIAAFAPILMSSIENAVEITDIITELTEASIPVLTSLAAMGAATASAALLTPVSTLMCSAMEELISKWGVFLSGAAAVCACSECISLHFDLNNLFTLIKRTVHVGAGLILSLFAGILKVQGLLGAGFDSVALKTARFAVDKLIPAVGGGIADTMDASVSSLLLVKSSVGITGILLMVRIFLIPVQEMCASLIGIRLACAVASPMSETHVVKAASKFGDVIRLLIILSAASLTMGLIILGSAVKAGMIIAA